MKRLIAIDGNSLMYRAYFALPKMTARNGAPTGAIHGFLSMLLKLLDYEPDHMLVAFDLPEPTFRHKRYSEYKAGRNPTPEDLIEQMPVLREIIEKMRIKTVSVPGFEADDILGTAARMAAEEGASAYLVTGDRDALQLINDNTFVIMTKHGVSETIVYDEKTLYEEYELTPDRMRDLKGLMGDTSDNIPGIPGVGKVTAKKLLKKYGTLEETLTRGADEEKGALKDKIITFAQSARLSYELGTIDDHAPLPFVFDDFKFDKNTLKEAQQELLKFDLRSIANRLPGAVKVDKSADNADAMAADAEKNGEKSQKTPKTTRTSGPVTINMPEHKHIQSVKTVYKLINTEDGLKELVPTLQNAENIAFDMGETGATLACDAKLQYNISFAQTLLEQGIDAPTALEILKPVFESHVKKTVYDAKKLMHTLKRLSIKLCGLDCDLMIMDYVLNAVHPSSSLKELVGSRLEADFTGAAQALLIKDAMTAELEELGLLDLYRDMERPLILVLYDMERTGVAIDRRVIEELGRQISDTRDKLEREIYALAGEEFNLQSPKQLGTVLFEKLALKHGRKTARGYSTDAAVLESLSDAHPIVPLVIEHRFLAKLKSTFIDGLLTALDPISKRIYSTFNQNVTVTGRISSTEPNLQNIPVRTPLGREIRRAFVSSPGNMLVDADYSQIELRVLAHVSADPVMIKTFTSGGDIHKETASEVFSVPYDEVTSAQRRAAKAVNFGIVYGMSDFGLAKSLGITKKEAGEYIKSYFRKYSGVENYMEESVSSARELGYAKTIFGRRRYLYEFADKNHNVRSFGERVARNMPIQGTAADIIKLAMVAVNRELAKRGFKAKLVLQIHDELIIDTPMDEVEEVKKLLCDCMSNVCELKVPLVAEVVAGHSWFDCK